MADIDLVLERLISDRAFRSRLGEDPAAALIGYDLSADDLQLLAGSLDSGDDSQRSVEQRTSKSAMVGLLASLTGGAQGGAGRGVDQDCDGDLEDARAYEGWPAKGQSGEARGVSKVDAFTIKQGAAPGGDGYDPDGVPEELARSAGKGVAQVGLNVAPADAAPPSHTGSTWKVEEGERGVDLGSDGLPESASRVGGKVEISVEKAASGGRFALDIEGAEPLAPPGSTGAGASVLDDSAVRAAAPPAEDFLTVEDE